MCTKINDLANSAPGRPAGPFCSYFEVCFMDLEDSENGKVQKVSPKGIYKGRMPWATKIIILIIFTVKRNVLRNFWDLHFVIREVGWPGFASET